MRQNSDVHEEVVGELLALGRGAPGLRVRCPKTSGSSCWRPNWAPAARWSATARELSELARKELGVVAAAARAVERYGPAAVPNYVISMCQSVSDMLEAAILLKEAGLLDVSGPEPYCPVGISPLFETIDDLHHGASILQAMLELPLYRAVVDARGDSRR